jgi:serine/threonine protein phosphatase 1
MLVKHEANTCGRDFFVGDLHGEYRLLQEALQGVDFDRAKDRLFSVGDLIDRGEASLDCLSLAREPWFFAVRGNHEVMAQAALQEGRGSAWDSWMLNGGDWILNEDAREVRALLDEALNHLPYARQVEVAGRQVGMVHAEPPEDWGSLESTGPDTLVWGRNRIARGDETPVDGIDAVVVGHTIIEEPLVLGNVHYIDTGAFHSGRLTLIDARELLS